MRSRDSQMGRFCRPAACRCRLRPRGRTCSTCTCSRARSSAERGTAEGFWRVEARRAYSLSMTTTLRSLRTGFSIAALALVAACNAATGESNDSLGPSTDAAIDSGFDNADGAFDVSSDVPEVAPVCGDL